MATTWLEKWQGVLGSTAAILVILLQVIQVLLSSGIENTLDNKTEQIRAKTDALSVILEANNTSLNRNNELLKADSELIRENGEVSRGNRALLEEQRKRAEETLAHIIALEKELSAKEAGK